MYSNYSYRLKTVQNVIQSVKIATFAEKSEKITQQLERLHPGSSMIRLIYIGLFSIGPN